MRASALFAALAGMASTLFAQEVPAGIAPPESPPPGCKQTMESNFTINILRSPKARRESAQQAAGSALECTLEDGIMRDPNGRIASIVANRQFQFDGPPQAGAIYTGGFSVCENNSLALGGSTNWWRCMSGEFGNLYDQSIGGQCHLVKIVALPVELPSSILTLITPPSTASANASASSASTSTSEDAVSTTGSPAGTASTAVPSGSGSASASSTPSASAVEADSSSAPSSESTGGALPTRVPRRETFGAVVGILGAALIL